MFNPRPRVEVLDLAGGQRCVVVDEALLDPDALVSRVASRGFGAPEGNAYPGVLQDCPPELEQGIDAFFTQYARSALGGRRTISMYARFSMVTVPPHLLRPGQSMCHRDRVVLNPAEHLCAAGVLYLFRDAKLGGTAFYRPRCAPSQLEQLLADAQALDAKAFADRYGVAPGYMTAANEYFEQIAVVPAAWNRMIFYDGGQFHSGHIEHPTLLSATPTRGRLTLNGFFACRRGAASSPSA